MKTILKKILATFISVIFGLTSLSIFNFTVAQTPYDKPLDMTLNRTDSSLGSVAIADKVDGAGADLFNNQILRLIDYIIYIFIAI